jgi:glutathione-regulated potassium-efflux system ancillary protein KefG
LLLCHPALERSRVNRALVEAARHVEGVHVQDLYEEYPDFDVDVRAEQRLLEAHDVLVLQHPFYWYSTPALLKQWFDLVLEYGWAYGPGGHALEGKLLGSALSTGGRAEAYRPGGLHDVTMEDLLAPIRQTARLCGLRWQQPFVVHGSFRLSDAELAEQAQGYVRWLEALASAAPAQAGKQGVG